MLVFPLSKINLGLHVVEKRPDGFHNIETVFYPVTWCDALEVLENKETAEPFVMSFSGIAIAGELESNLVYKAWKLISKLKTLPPVKVHLHKNIPMGAGLGGGSSDAAFFITALNTKFNLNLSASQMLAIASEIGSDCAFFIEAKPVLATGKGNLFSPLGINLGRYYIQLVYPAVNSNTKEAYSGLIPKKPTHKLQELVQSNQINTWKDLLVNDFEESIFKRYTQVAVLKKQLYSAGALYAGMSGSGSAVFGIFEQEPQLNFPKEYLHYLQKPAPEIL